METDSPYFPGASNAFKLLRGRPVLQESDPDFETAFPTANPISAGAAAVRGACVQCIPAQGSRIPLGSGPPGNRPKWVWEGVRLHSFYEKVMHDEFSLIKRTLPLRHQIFFTQGSHSVCRP